MSSRNGNALLQPHQFRQHFGAADHGNAPFARGHQFGIITADCGRHHHHFGLADIVGRMADKYRHTQIAQAFDIGIVGRIRALHGIAKIMQHFGNTGHADTANSDKMNGTQFTRQFHCDDLPSVPTMSSTRSANRSAPSVMPRFFALCAESVKDFMSII